jgi:electron transfer flavoprotein-quinone oxidoreductase
MLKKPLKSPGKIAPTVGTINPPPIERKYFDVLVVGAGPAGSTAAYFLANGGLDVALFERATPGDKAVGGAAVYAIPTHEMFPNFWDEAPIERIITDQRYIALTEDSAITLSFKSEKYAQAPYNRLAVHRAKFDRWLADKAVSEGAVLFANHKVDELLQENGKIIGLKVGPPINREFYAEAVVLAEGVNSLLAERAGLVPRIKAKNMALYVKEVMALGLNVGTLVSTFADSKFNPHDYVLKIKNHPALKPYFEGSQTVEYSAHMLPEGGYYAIPTLVHPSCLIVGDAAGLVNGIQGLNLAMLSGKMAAKTLIIAKHLHDFSRHQLSLYQELLDDSYIMQDLRASHLAHGFYLKRPWVPEAEIAVVTEMAYQMGMIYTMPKRAKRLFIWKKATSIQPVWKLLSDFFNALWVMK